MTLDGRGRRAGEGLRHEIDDLTATDPDRGSFERFEALRRRKQRNQRVGAGIVAGAIAVLALVFVARALPDGERNTAGLPGGGGRILYGDWDAQAQRAEWQTVSPDGSSSRDLDLAATCAIWFPDGSRILATNDAASGPGSPLRPRGSSTRTAPTSGPWTPRGTRTSTSGAATCPPMVVGSHSRGSAQRVTPNSTASTRSAPRTAAISSGWSGGRSRRRGTRPTAHS